MSGSFNFYRKRIGVSGLIYLREDGSLRKSLYGLQGFGHSRYVSEISDPNDILAAVGSAVWLPWAQKFHHMVKYANKERIGHTYLGYKSVCGYSRYFPKYGYPEKFFDKDINPNHISPETAVVYEEILKETFVKIIPAIKEIKT